MASLQDTFDIASFAAINPVGFAVSMLLLLVVVVASYLSIKAHSGTYVEINRLYVKRMGITKEFAIRVIGAKHSDAPSFKQRVEATLRSSWTCGALCVPLDGDPFPRLQRMLVLVCTTLSTLAVSVLFYKPQSNTRQICEGVPLENGYPTQCSSGWMESQDSCTCKLFDCQSCDCNICNTLAACGRHGCVEILPESVRDTLVTLSITVPTSLVIKAL